MDIKHLIKEYGPVIKTGPESAYIPYKVITFYHPDCDEPLGYGTCIFHQAGTPGSSEEWEDLDPSEDYISASGRGTTIHEDIEEVELYA